jgi:PAS domain S-box-containing protein
MGNARGQKGDLGEANLPVGELQELEEANEALRKECDKARMYLDMADVICLVVGSDQMVRFINRRGCEILGYRPEEVIGRDWFECFVPHSAREEVQACFLGVLEGRGDRGEYREHPVLAKNGEERIVCWHNKPIENDEGRAHACLSSGHDVTERRRAEKLLWESEQRFRKFVEGTDDIVNRIDENGRILYVNQVARRIYGLEPGQCLGLSIFEFIHPDDRQKSLRAFRSWMKEGLTGVTYENRQMNRAGEVHHILWTINFHYDEEGALEGVNCIGRDITELRLAETRLSRSLEEKDVLLRELYHRTKNNMQVICSLIALQSARLENGQVLQVFKELADRIRSMALVHEKLYQSDDLSSIDLKGYIEELGRNLLLSYRVRTDRIALKFQMDSVPVSIDTAVPCGLVLNELVSNALKYAFPGDREGEIEVRLCSETGKGMELVVRDNGVGMPEGVEIENSRTLGLQLVRNLVRHQLSGTITLEKGDGVEFRIAFPENSRL